MLKKKLQSKIFFFYPKTADEKISKRSLNNRDYIIIYITLLYMIFKNLFINKTKIFIKKYTTKCNLKLMSFKKKNK